MRWSSSQAHDEWTKPLVKELSHTFLSDPLASRSFSRYSHVAFSFEMKRLSWHTVINIILPLFLLSSSVFVIVTQATADTRLQVVSALLTAAIAMRFVSASLLPKISYTTELDKNVLGCLISLVVAGIESSLRISVEAKYASIADMAHFDQWFFIAHSVAWVIFNLVFIPRLLTSWEELTTRRLRPCEDCLAEEHSMTADALACLGHDPGAAVDMYAKHQSDELDKAFNVVTCCICWPRTEMKRRMVDEKSGRILCVKHKKLVDEKLIVKKSP